MLHHLHLGVDGQAQGRGDRTRRHLQLRPRRGRGVRDAGGRSGLPGHDDRLRLLGRGDLGAPAVRGDAGPPAPGRHAARPRAVGVPQGLPGHRAVLRPDPAGHPRPGPSRPAVPAGLRGGVPGRPRTPLAPARPQAPQRVRPDGGHRHRDLQGAPPERAGDPRGPAADLLRRHPRPGRGTGAAPRRAGRDRHRRHRPGRGVRQPRRPHGEGVHPGLPRAAGQSVRPHLPDRGPGPGQRRRRDRVPRPHRHPGADPRIPHRTRRDRIGAAPGAGGRAGRGRHLRAGARSGRAGGLLQPPRGHPSPRPGGHLPATARAPSRLHGPRLRGAVARHPDAAEQQGRPQEPPAAEGPPLPVHQARLRGPVDARGDHPGRHAGRGRVPRTGVGRQPLLRRAGGELAAHGPLLRPRQGAGGPRARVDEGRLPAPHGQEPGHGARGRRTGGGAAAP